MKTVSVLCMILPRSGGCKGYYWVGGVGQKNSETQRKTRLRVQAGNCTEKAPKKGNISGWGPLAFGSCVGGALVQCPKKEEKRLTAHPFLPFSPKLCRQRLFTGAFRRRACGLKAVFKKVGGRCHWAQSH